MPDILHDFRINAPAAEVFRAVSTPAGLATWWTKNASGQAALGEEFLLDFGPGYEWRARVTRFSEDRAFELTMHVADDDWSGTTIAFELTDTPAGTAVSFQHAGWREANKHFRVSSHCWAMYLRLLRRSVEFGEFVAYEHRLEA